MAGGAVVICLAGYFAYVTLRSHQTIAPVETSSVQTISAVNQPAKEANNKVNEPANAVPRRATAERSTATKAPLQSRAATPEQARNEDADDALRSGNVVANLRLKDIKKIYLDFRGDAAFDDLRDSLVKSLGSSGVVTVANNADDADAALKIVVSQTGSQIEAAARLVNAKGTVLWPKAASVARRYSGEPTTVVSQIVKDLLLEIRHAR